MKYQKEEREVICKINPSGSCSHAFPSELICEEAEPSNIKKKQSKKDKSVDKTAEKQKKSTEKTKVKKQKTDASSTKGYLFDA